MSKKASRQLNFMRFAAQFSERMKANGDYVGFASPELFADLKTQWVKGRLRIRELEAIEQRTPEQQRELMNHIRVTGDWSHLLRQCGQVAFENAFVVVAQARLPKEHFLVICNEARRIWSECGYAKDLPIPAKKLRKAYRKFKQRNKGSAMRLATNFAMNRQQPASLLAVCDAK